MFFPELIKLQRAQAGLSQNKMAEKLGVDRTTYNKWETGENKPTLNRLVAVAGILGVSPGSLIEQEDPKPEEKTKPTIASLSAEEQELIKKWRQLSEPFKAQLNETLEFYVEYCAKEKKP